jgi:hypothetical protein
VLCGFKFRYIEEFDRRVGPILFMGNNRRVHYTDADGDVIEGADVLYLPGGREGFIAMSFENQK